MKKQEIELTLSEIEFLKTLPLEEREEIEVDNNIAFFFFCLSTEELLEDYIKSIISWYLDLQEMLEEEEYGIAARLRDAIKFEEDEFKRMIKTYHRSPNRTSEEIIEAIELVNNYTKNKFIK
jgi:hypothetical protein